MEAPVATVGLLMWPTSEVPSTCLPAHKGYGGFPPPVERIEWASETLSRVPDHRRLAHPGAERPGRAAAPRGSPFP